MAVSGTGTLVFTDDVAQEDTEGFRHILSAQIQLNGVKLIGQRFITQIYNDPNIQPNQPRSLLK